MPSNRPTANVLPYTQKRGLSEVTVAKGHSAFPLAQGTSFSRNGFFFSKTIVDGYANFFEQRKFLYTNMAAVPLFCTQG